MNIKELIKQTYKLSVNVKAQIKEYNQNRMTIQQFFDDKKIKELEVDTEEDHNIVKIIAKKVEQLKIEYDLVKLKLKLDKEIYNEVTTKQYMITNFDEFVNVLKHAGVTALDVKKFINVVETVNKNKITELYSVGDITQNDLRGCYTAELVKHIRFSMKKGD